MSVKENRKVYVEYIDGLLRLYVFSSDSSGIVLEKFKVVPAKSLSHKESLAKSVDDLFVDEYCHDLSVTLVLPDMSCAQRYLRFPTVRDDEILTMLKNHSQQFVPYRQDELLFAYNLVSSDQEGYSDILSLMLLHKDAQVLFDVLLEKGLFLDNLYTKPMAISSFFGQKKKITAKEESLLLYKDKGKIWAMVFVGSQLAMYRSIDYSEDKDTTKGFIFDTLGLYIRSSAAGPVNNLYLSGDFVEPKAMLQFLENELTMQVDYVDSGDWTRFPNKLGIEQFSKNCIPIFALAQGGLNESLSFVPEELQERNTIRKVLKKHFVGLFLWLIFCLLLLIAGSVKGYKLRSAYENVDLALKTNVEKTRDLVLMREVLQSSKTFKEELGFDLDFFHLLHASFSRSIELVEIEKDKQENLRYRVLARAETREQVYDAMDLIKGLQLFKEDEIKINYLTSVEDRGKERFIFELIFSKLVNDG